jgi:hypothetical protein
MTNRTFVEPLLRRKLEVMADRTWSNLIFFIQIYQEIYKLKSYLK